MRKQAQADRFNLVDLARIADSPLPIAEGREAKTPPPSDQPPRIQSDPGATGSDISGESSPETTKVVDLSGAVGRLAAEIKRGPVTKRRVQEILNEAYGGTMAEGKYDAKDMGDAVEMAVNRHVMEAGADPLNADAAGAVEHVTRLKAMLDNTPTQTTRTAEMDKLQQFSTPPPLSYVANWVAKLRPDDVVLEPSAGVGGLAVFGKAAGARVLANELSDRRAGLLGITGIADWIYKHNAEHLNALLTPDIALGKVPAPTAVVMNPPFSNAAKSNRSNTLIGGKHVEEALKLLPKGGRLVAIVGSGMALDRPMFKGWWDKIRREYNVRANVQVNGEEYRKYGTSFDNQIVVIDKTGPTPESSTVGGRVEKVEDLIPLLDRIRNERPTLERVEPASTEPGGAAADAHGGAGSGPGADAPAGPGARGASGGGRGGLGGVGSAGAGELGPEPAAPGERAGVAGERGAGSGAGGEGESGAGVGGDRGDIAEQERIARIEGIKVVK